jgi:hypothetical protein
MRQFFLFSSFLIFCGASVLAQKNGSIKGVAYDTLFRKAVADATIVLVKKDSSLLTFGMTDMRGAFLWIIFLL